MISQGTLALTSKVTFPAAAVGVRLVGEADNMRATAAAWVMVMVSLSVPVPVAASVRTASLEVVSVFTSYVMVIS